MIIYKIINLVNNKIYIGQTTRSFNLRIKDHKRMRYDRPLYKAFQKYGFDNFKFEIIDTVSNLDELNKKEIYYINEYKSNNKKYGYNLESGGKNSQPNFETLKKMSRSHKGIKQSDSWINKRIAKKGSIEAKKYGKKKTKKEKKYLSENSPKYWMGKNRSEETKRKISQTKLNKGLSDKQKELLCKKVIAYDPISNKILNVFESSTIAAKFYKNISQSTISRRCTGKTKNKGNIHFKYDDIIHH